MVYRRRFSKKRYIRKSISKAVRAAKGAVFTYKVKKVIQRMAEHKQNEITLDSAVPYASLVPVAAGANGFNLLTAIAQGTDNSNRLGDQASGYVVVKGMIRNTSSTAANVVRLTVVTDTAQSNTISANVAPVQSNIYVNPTDLYSTEFVKQRRYNIVHRRIWNLGPSISGSGQKQFMFKIPKRILNWTAGSTAATDCSKGISYLLLEAEVASTVENTFNACTYFTDL